MTSHPTSVQEHAHPDSQGLLPVDDHMTPLNLHIGTQSTGQAGEKKSMRDSKKLCSLLKTQSSSPGMSDQ